jgi:hypothetical protein
MRQSKMGNRDWHVRSLARGNEIPRWTVAMSAAALAVILGLLSASMVRADSTSTQSSNSQVHVGHDSSGSDISVDNGVVTVDGEVVPPEAREFTSRKGNHYRIDHHGGSVEVHQE